MKKRKSALSLLSVTAALLAGGCPETPPIESQTPGGDTENPGGGGGGTVTPSGRMNIILFMVDDMGLNDSSVQFLDRGSELHDYYYTPNMERLAEKGVRFTSAYASPVSSPTRISLMTGSNAARHRVTNWTLELNDNTDASFNNNLAGQPWNWNGISPDVNGDVTSNNIYEATTFPQILQKNGYRTIHLGKAHWGAISTKAAEPLNLGFNVNIGGAAPGGPDNYALTNASQEYTGFQIPFPRLNEYATAETNYHITDAITNAARSEIDRAVEDGTPFYMYMSHYAVHSPYTQPDERFYEFYEGKSTADQTIYGTRNKNYGTLVTGMDKSLGELMDYLEEKGIADKTILIFMADNGGHHDNKNTPLRGSKGSMWEGGIHEPMMVYWPGVTDVYAGQTNDSPVIIEDFYPTILEMAGVAPGSYDSELKQTVDGKSFVSALKGNKLINTDRALYFHYPNKWGEATTLNSDPVGFPSSAIIKDGWKYIYFYGTGKEYLFNLTADEIEETNLAETNAEKKAELAKDLSDYLKSVDATMVYDSTSGTITYPDGTTDNAFTYKVGDDNVFYIDINDQNGSVENEPLAGRGVHTGAVTEEDNFAISFEDGTEVTGSIAWKGTVKPNGDGGRFATVEAANAFGSLFSGFTKEETLSNALLPVWADAVTLETDSPSAVILLDGLPEGTYEIGLLSVRNNNWYGTNNGSLIKNAVYEITTGTVSGAEAFGTKKNVTDSDLTEKAVKSDNGKFTVNQDADTGSEVWGFRFSWTVTPVDGTIEITVSGTCSLNALRVEKLN